MVITETKKIFPYAMTDDDEAGEGNLEEKELDDEELGVAGDLEEEEEDEEL